MVNQNYNPLISPNQTSNDENKPNYLYPEAKRLDEYWYDIPRECAFFDEQTNKDLVTLAYRKYLISEEFMRKRQTIFRKRYSKYTNPSEFRDAIIKVHTLHQHIKMFQAMFYDTNLSASFTGQNMSHDESAWRLRKRAEYDQVAMWKKDKDFRHLRNLWFYWSAVRIPQGWNEIKQTLEYIEVNPLNWYPDPDWNVIDNNFEYHFFPRVASGQSLISANANSKTWCIFENLDKLQVSTNLNWEKIRNNVDFLQVSRWLSDYDSRREKFLLLDWYMKINWRRYMLTLWNNWQLLMRFEPVPLMWKEEKKNPSLAPDPVNVTNLFPLEWDPMWMWYGELIMDKQNAINRMVNMALIKEQREAWFLHYIVDTSVVSNINYLKTRPVDWPIFVPWRRNDGRPVEANPVIPVVENNQTWSTFVTTDKVDLIAQLETWMTTQNRWVAVDPNTTGGQSQLLAQNSNILFSLDATVIWMWEVRFWRDMRYRAIKLNFWTYEEKVFRLWTGITWQTYKIKKEDVVSWIDPDIMVTSSKLQKEKNREMLAYLTQKAPTVMADPSTPPVAKKIFARYLDELQGIDRDLIYKYNPLWKDERRALDIVSIVNSDIMPKNFFKPWMDLYTFWLYIQEW